MELLRNPFLTLDVYTQLSKTTFVDLFISLVYIIVIFMKYNDVEIAINDTNGDYISDVFPAIPTTANIHGGTAKEEAGSCEI